MPKQKIVVAITGASGSIYAQRLLNKLFVAAQTNDLEIGVVLSKNAETVWVHEIGSKPEIPFRQYERGDYFAPFASGSAKYENMVIIPCSMGTLSRIANGISDDLVTRAADVILKERHKLICVVRDTPYSQIHIENMLKITQCGGIILPASPSFYSLPKTIDELVDSVIQRVLDKLGIESDAYRWGRN